MGYVLTEVETTKNREMCKAVKEYYKSVGLEVDVVLKRKNVFKNRYYFGIVYTYYAFGVLHYITLHYKTNSIGVHDTNGNIHCRVSEYVALKLTNVFGVQFDYKKNNEKVEK